ncbi:MAG: glycosyltransferase, partial [Actinobacteria bacterium]|nr:glycosyltransferase [Actinomycetota bacterium]
MSSEKVKILFVIDHLDGGGAEKQCLNVVNNINRAGFEPCLFLTEKQGILFKKLKTGIKTFGMLNSEHRNTVKTLFQLKRTLSAFRPHIVHSWADYSSFITAFTLKTMHNPPMFIATQLGSREEVYNYEVSFGRLKKKLLIWSYTKADLVTTCAKSIKNQLKHYGINNVTVIYDGIDSEHLMDMPSKDYLREKLSLDRDIIYISYVGTLVESKGVSCLIEAFKDLKHRNTALLIIGKGSLENYFKKIAAGSDRIKFLGYRTNAAEYIKASDIFALPSVHEGLPNVILEAMAVGTPVIATNVYGIPELIENGVNGLLIPPKNAKNLARVIEQIIDTPEIAKRYADASFEKVRFFNIKRMVGEY